MSHLLTIYYKFKGQGHIGVATDDIGVFVKLLDSGKKTGLLR